MESLTPRRRSIRNWLGNLLIGRLFNQQSSCLAACFQQSLVLEDDNEGNNQNINNCSDNNGENFACSDLESIQLESGCSKNNLQQQLVVLDSIAGGQKQLSSVSSSDEGSCQKGICSEDTTPRDELSDVDENHEVWHDVFAEIEEGCADSMGEVVDENMIRFIPLISCQNQLNFLGSLRKQLEEINDGDSCQVVYQIEQLMQAGKIVQAAEKWRRLKKCVELDLPDDFGIEYWANDVEQGLQQIDDFHGYSKTWDRGLVIYYRHKRGHPHYSFKLLSFFPVHPVLFNSLLTEFDLVSSWSHYVPQSLVLEDLAALHSYVMASLWFPWPLRNRQLVYETTYFDLLDEQGCFLITMKSIPKVAWKGIKGFPEEAYNRVTFDLVEGSCVKVSPRLEDGEIVGVEVTTQLHINPNMFEIPKFIINFMITVLGPFMYQMAMNIVEKQLMKGQGQYIERMKQRRQLYDYLRKRVDNYVEITSRKNSFRRKSS